ncbi:aldehyde dehydrogenase family protein [Gilvimarinus sp. F26214L]|uniref:aldehyde dehydrogenase family protein n=1 Tax=Gilvimarinus sp. DZF01 TaxID=3461371 RepID=UPI0040465E6B
MTYISYAQLAKLAEYGDFSCQFIGGEWRSGNSQRLTKNRNPYTNEVLVEIPNANRDDLDAAYQAAREAQADWAAALPGERAEVMRRAALIMEARREEIIGWLIRESGSTRLKATLEWETVHAVMLEAASFPYLVEGHIIPADVPGKESRVYRKPVGVVGVISPWNWPMQLSNRSVASALAVGNAVVLKPASDTPVTGGTLLAKIYEEAGLPAGVLNVVIGAGSEIGDPFVGHPVPRVISFTGSTPVGRNLFRLIADSPILKKVELELGGNSPFVVLEDADLDLAVEAAVFGKYLHQGQICMITNRFVVHSKVYDEFVERLAERVRHLKVGDPNEPDTLIGPIINESQLQTLQKHIESLKQSGAREVAGGDAQDLLLPPQVFSEVTAEMPVAQQELFGPIALLMRASSEEDALALANDTEYGLSSCVFTRDVERGVRFAQKLQAGMAHVNDQPVNDLPFSPFGGEKNSGVGRFNGRWAIDAFTTDQWVTVQHGPRPYPTHADQISGPWAGG